MEHKLWMLDSLLIFILIYITFLEKPYWCIKKGLLMTNDCTEDIYGNEYDMIYLIRFNMKNTFLFSSFIMVYFNLKYYIIYLNMRTNLNLI